jgi:hypothetical protein
LNEVETKVLNQSVKRNHERFPADFMFQLTREEFETIRFQAAAIEKNDQSLRSQIVTLETGRGRYPKYLPYAFTEQGVGMLSGVLNSDKAVNMHIAITRAFVEIRKLLLKPNDLRDQLQEIKARLGEHDVQLNNIYDAIENLLDEKAAQRSWENRDRIGFIKHDH